MSQPDRIELVLTQAQALVVKAALAVSHRNYDEQLRKGIKGTRLPGQAPVSYGQRLQLVIECERLLIVALHGPRAYDALWSLNPSAPPQKSYEVVCTKAARHGRRGTYHVIENSTSRDVLISAHDLRGEALRARDELRYQARQPRIIEPPPREPKHG